MAERRVAKHEMRLRRGDLADVLVRRRQHLGGVRRARRRRVGGGHGGDWARRRIAGDLLDLLAHDAPRGLAVPARGHRLRAAEERVAVREQVRLLEAEVEVEDGEELALDEADVRLGELGGVARPVAVFGGAVVQVLGRT